MSDTYKAVEVTAPGTLRVVERPIRKPGAGQVRIRVEACGICHSDVLAVEGLLPNAEFPRVPGHEAIGRIDALGAGVTGWKVGQRVGVGFLGGNCGQCAQCRRGDFVNCLPAKTLQQLGGATVILATASSSKSHSGLLGGLRPGGSVLVVGLDGGPIEIGSTDLVLSERSVDGSKTGSAQDGEDTLAFSVLQNIRPMIETVPLEQAADAYARMMQGKPRFRMVLVTGAPVHRS